MTLREQIEDFRRRMALFNEWEAAQPPVERSSAAIIADLGFVLSFISREERLRDPDPEKLGIQRMHAGMALVGRGR